MVSESQLIGQVRKMLPVQGRGLRVGIGDDAAVFRLSAGKDWVVTTDAFLENVHFVRNSCPARAAGHKAIARATSDIAAMGAEPRYFFLTLGIPDLCTGAWLNSFLDGMAKAARSYGLTLAGGDTTKFPVVIASLTVIGEIERGRAVLRSGARPGHLIYVSGTLGEAQLGYELFERKLHKNRRWARLLKKHSWPEPRLALGALLATHRLASSMIDTSDGLSTDLGHICEASRVGAKVWAEKIPAAHLPDDLQRVGGGLNALRMALHGGEDYELLFTVPKNLAKRVPRKLGGVPLTPIGEITRGTKVLLIEGDGHTVTLKPKGWDPFRKNT